ncbi:RelA/SpoT domain-containing protein [Cronobacter sakazakii]|uniref:RelA/SpoT domain-containing protein n=1 Tax=Cronobacter TaxID=413496 RepID=UPI000B4AFFB2|nr:MULTISPECIES: RelA/SpoT domain-containing protein [Cronobacter]ELY4663412.1 RelA/SpoT domain-containing protein [Cronobacter muytjensii]ELY2717817.1 RelA/SpoT domain-containing protein [Cronobacter sakazakii]KAB0899197.1 RelA/SpoT domain-containing protein [Cronobacter sakazakii]KAB0906921.1 RelA/SpoT domain-containing protein [Cronobacter sakazakii]KAB0911064.1 RelA/SpoT domain-containing protein [Cronobacter sakazakii]
MGNEVYESQKCTLKYSKSQIDKAAQLVRHGCNGAEREEAIAIIQNFRELHLYPLMLIKNHLARASVRVDKKIIVARRLKRLSTIIDKLERSSLDGGKTTNSIKMTRMQDIGGCRAIVKNIEQLKLLRDRLIKSRSVHKVIRESNYLTPKESGYGGIHLIYSCFDGSEDKFPWKKTKIEVQLRTELQHAWATSLEIIDTLENIKLKTSNEGHTEWRRFFYIAGCLVAHDERACILSKDKVEEYQKELSTLESELDVRKKLASYVFSLSVTSDDKLIKKLPKNYRGHFLVTMKREPVDPDNKDKIRFAVALEAFKIKEADEALEALKRDDADPEVLIAVLLATDNIKSLKKAYPNYLGSTSQFDKFLNKHIK